MAAKTMRQRAHMGLLLLATLTVVSVSAQNLYVGPGAVVIRQYRPGVGIYRPHGFNYFGPGPIIYGPLVDARVQIHSAPRIQPYAVYPHPSTPVLPGPYNPTWSSPYGEYYTPHIPRYYRHQETAEPSEAPTAQNPQSDQNGDSTRQQTVSETPVPIPVPGQAEDAGQKKVTEAPAGKGGQISPSVADQPPRREASNQERQSKSTRRKPIRYR